jgi:hypothetical protein
MTTETTAGQNGLNVLIEIESSGNLRSIASDSTYHESQNKQTTEGDPGITHHLLGTTTEMKTRSSKVTQY